MMFPVRAFSVKSLLSAWYFFQTVFSPLLTFSVGAVSAGITKHFMFHISWSSMLLFLYLILFSASFHIAFLSYGTATCITKKVISFFILIIMSGLSARTCLSIHLSMTFKSTVLSSSSHTDVGNVRTRLCCCWQWWQIDHTLEHVCWETFTFPRMSVGLGSIKGRKFTQSPQGQRMCPRNLHTVWCL